MLVPLVSRLCALSLRPAVSSCRSASREVKAWTNHHFAQRVPGRRQAQDQNTMNQDDTMMDVEDKLDELLSEERKKKMAVKFSKIKRRMTPSGAPERRLSWDTIEQIRYLRRERPEEWTVERLSQGFGVPPDDILRVLKSKFNPTASRKLKQDASVTARLGQPTARLPAGGVPQGSLLPPPAQNTLAALEAGDGASGPVGALVPSANRMLPTPRAEEGRGGGELSGTPPGGGGGGGRHASLTTRPKPLSLTTVVESSRLTPAPSISEEDPRGAPPVERGEGEDDDDDEEERWDGEVLTESELEELMLTIKPSTTVKVGRDIFDADGGFLYRI